MAKINFNVDLVNLEGKTINSYKECCLVEDGNILRDKNGVAKYLNIETPEESLTLKIASVEALLTNSDDLTKEDKTSNYILANKIHKSDGEIDIKSEEIVSIKKFIGKYYGPLVAGQCDLLLENEKINEG